MDASHTSSERSLSLSDTELSSPELAVCYDLHGTAEEEEEEEEEEDGVIEEKEQEISENGEEVVCLQTMFLFLYKY